MVTDSVLEFFVQEVEDTGMSFAITLYMRGNIIRVKQYYDELSTFLDEDTETSMEDMDPKERQVFENYKENLRQFARDRLRHSKYESGFLHLRRATITQCGSDESYAILWRGKISSVDSFSLGGKIQVPEVEE